MTASVRSVVSLDSSDRARSIRERILSKPFLKRFYEERYDEFRRCLERAPQGGMAVEIGSGAGFLKTVLPIVTTSDVLPYDGVDRVLDATRLDLPNASVRAVYLFDVLHHIPDAEAFFSELDRVLVPGGRVLITDQYVGWISKWILKYAHHEPFDDRTERWSFETSGPLSGANGALSWIVFFRDRARFKKLYPRLAIASVKRHSPFRYWISGGLKAWSLAPGILFGFWSIVDAWTAAVFPKAASFFSVELVKTAD